ncbi:hypothetical protein ART_0130 [Arthrobacter sp. PAMC 25486]|uniref:hypothetical protein n=1 Tax=Arthrobacter sp. PAMC 25486 TaxID=1494608 RepID=UPI00053600CC|nr:hypothetical protein [Arthrobacter sp. PAMC 25486]AIX99728.1 hypothetical protein ART_0130 [Arthrobacter sp. PAMC 25486]
MAHTGPDAALEPVDGLTRRHRRATAAAPWSSWPFFFAVTGAGAGVLWWLLAPGGAFYGDGSDFKVWLPRDATLALLLTLAGVLSAVLALRGSRVPWRTRRPGTAEKPSLPLYFGLLLGGLAASVLAWRIGVFAGDLFQTPPANMASPSMLFSLRSPTVLMLWPLSTSLVIFASKLFAYSFLAEPKAEPLRSHDLLRG